MNVAHRDYYNVLGVQRSAGQDDIKRAYRQMAMRFHPDRNPGDPEAEQHFKDVSEAYRVLSAPEERARYDRLGPLYNSEGRPPTPDDLNEVVGSMWKNLFGRRRKEPGENLRYTISASLEEVARGTERSIVVPRQVRCTTCDGHGATTAGRIVCSACAGSGRSSGARLFRTSCYHCEGRGYTVGTPCADCSGDGRHGQEDSITVKVPAGVATGQKLKLTRKGNEARDQGAGSGDLFVIVNVAEHSLFTRRGDDLLVDVPLTFLEATAGSDVPVPTLEGSTVIRIPPGTPHGKIFRLQGRGLPRVGRTARGDLHLQVMLEIPDQLSEAEQLTLAAWARALPDTRHPQRAAFDRAVQERR